MDVQLRELDELPQIKAKLEADLADIDLARDQIRVGGETTAPSFIVSSPSSFIDSLTPTSETNMFYSSSKPT